MALTARRSRVAMLFGLALLLSLPTLGRRDIVTSHEARVAQTARLMAEAWPWEGRRVTVGTVELTDADRTKRLVDLRGADGGALAVNPWLVPVLNGKIRLQKPPLPYWCTAVAFRLAGGFGEAAARAVPALMGATAVLLVASLARRLIGRTAAWLAALVWLGSYFVFDEYRKAMPDPYVAFLTLLAVWAWVRGTQGEDGRWKMEGGKADPRATLFHPLSSILVFYLALALGMLAKGPVVLLLVGVPVALYHVCYRRTAPGRWWWHAAGVGLFVALALPWYLYVWLRVPHAAEIWGAESVGEVGDSEARPWFFYVTVLQLALPWTPLLVVGAILAFARRRGAGRAAAGPASGPDAPMLPPPRPRDRRAWFGVLWLAALVLAFSLVKQKKNAYLLPAMPAVVLVVTQGLLAVVGGARRTRFTGTPGTLAVVQALIGAAAALATGVLALRAAAGPDRGAFPPAGVAVAAGAAVLLLAYAPLWAVLRRRPPRRWAAAQGVAYAAVVAALFALYLDPKDNPRSAKPVCAEFAELLRRGGHAVKADQLPEEAGVYLPLDVESLGNPFANRVLLLRDDGGDVRDRAKGRAVKPFVPGPRAVDGRIVSFRRVPMQSAPGDARWKVYEVEVDRSQVASGTR